MFNRSHSALHRVAQAAAVLAVLATAGVGAVALTSTAQADVSKKVSATFKGKLLLSTGPLEPGADDKTTVAEWKKKALTVLAGRQNGNDVQEWSFNYTAFLSKTGSSTLSLEFYDGAKYSADRKLTGVDPKDPIIEGDITIDEDEGLTKGKTYTLKLVASIKGKDVTVAQSVVTLQ